MTNNTLQQHIIDVCRIQDQVNRISLGDDWKYKGYQQIEVDYAFAAVDEVSEFWRSALHYKWWAKAKDKDIDNAITELVDILHFGVSQEMIYQYYVNGVTSTDDAYAKIAAEAQRDADNAKRYLTDTSTQRSKFPEVALRTVVKKLLSGLTASHIEEHDVFTWAPFWEMTYLIGATPELIVSRYKAKAQLNIFRQANGYKQGTYVKYWKDGKEDNYFLTEYLKTLTEYPGDDEIQKWLNANYLLCTAPAFKQS